MARQGSTGSTIFPENCQPQFLDARSVSLVQNLEAHSHSLEEPLRSGRDIRHRIGNPNARIPKPGGGRNEPGASTDEPQLNMMREITDWLCRFAHCKLHIWMVLTKIYRTACPVNCFFPVACGCAPSWGGSWRWRSKAHKINEITGRHWGGFRANSAVLRRSMGSQRGVRVCLVTGIRRLAFPVDKFWLRYRRGYETR